MTDKMPPNLKTVYTKEESAAAKKQKKALLMVLYIGRECQLRCQMCYAAVGEEAKKMAKGTEPTLSNDDYKQIIKEARALGIKTVCLSSEGDPMYNLDEFFDLAECIVENGMMPHVETNGLQIDAKVAQRMRELDFGIIGKCHSLNPALNDEIVGKQAYTYVEVGGQMVPSHIKALIDAGFTEDHAMALNTVVLRKNFDDIEALWRWERAQNIIPQVEFLVPTGNARNRSDLDITPEQRIQMHKKIYELDKEYGYDYAFKLGPYPGHRTCDSRSSLKIDLYGNCRVCACTYVNIGNVKDHSLEQLVALHYKKEEEMSRVYNNNELFCECYKYNTQSGDTN